MTKRTVLRWKDSGITRTHSSIRTNLIVSGCSFTDSNEQTDQPLTWPGYLCERAGFDQCIDLALSGAGNEYIATSVVNEVESMTTEQKQASLVIIVWSGIGRRENLKAYKSRREIDSITFERAELSAQIFEPGEALRSWKNIVMMQNYLENQKISFGFSSHVNLFDAPFFPRREASTIEWDKCLADNKIARLRQCSWLHEHKDSLFEWCFKKDGLLCEDMFHPNPQGYLDWTDHVLLPALVKKGLLQRG